MEKKKRETAGERRTLLRVREVKKTLHELLNDLPVKVTELSSNVDREFLSSYRVHMLSIQNEIKKLKQDVLIGEQTLNSDVEVAKLESEVKWFADECSRLKSHQIAMENDIKLMQERMSNLSEQKVYLAEQLKSIMKRNRVLKAEIDYISQFKPSGGQEYGLAGDDEWQNSPRSSWSDTSYDDNDNDDDNDNNNNNNNNNNNTQSMPNLLSSGKVKLKNSKKMEKSITTPSLVKTPYRTISRVDRGGKGRMPGSGLVECSTSAESLIMQELNEDEKQLKLLLEFKTDLELNLEVSIAQIFQELKFRKNESAKLANIKRFNKDEELDEEKPLDPVEPYMQANSVIFTSGGMGGLGLKQFSDNDKFSAIVKLLMNKNIAKQVVKRMQNSAIAAGEL